MKRVYQSEALWRYVDVFLPRVFALGIHSLLIARYGAGQYALVAWILGMMALIAGFIPDPHSYILLRGHGNRARNLLSLAAPWYFGKVFLSGAVTLLLVFVLASNALVAPHATSLWPVVSAAIVYASAELCWALVGFGAFASGDLPKVAKIGVIVRLISLLSLVAIAPTSIYVDLIIVGGPLAITATLLLPFSFRAKRIFLFAFSAIRRYSVWSILIGAATGLVGQAAPLMMGAAPTVAAKDVGFVSYFSRLIMVGLQPFQVLQSLVIKEVSMSGGEYTNRLRQSRIAFRVGAIFIGTVGACALALAYVEMLMSIEAITILSLFLFGAALSCWYRFEIALVLATEGIKELFLKGYLPTILTATTVAILAINLLGVAGIGVALFVAWMGISLSWKWSNAVQVQRYVG